MPMYEDTYTVRRPGCGAWVTGVQDLEQARWEARAADRHIPGHRVIRDRDSKDVTYDVVLP